MTQAEWHTLLLCVIAIEVFILLLLRLTRR